MIAFLKQRRNAWVVAAVLFGLGLWASAAIFISVFQEIGGLDRSFVRLIAPGEQTLFLAKAGQHTVYFEHKSEVDGRIYLAPPEAIAGLELEIEDADTGEKIPVALAKMKGSYSLGSREGSSVMAFVAPKPGFYRFDAEVPGGAAAPFVLAIGTGLVKNILSVIAKIFAMVLILIVSIAIPTVLIVITQAAKSPVKSPTSV